MFEKPSPADCEAGPPEPAQAARLEQTLRCRLGHRIQGLRIWFEPHGLVITGYTRSYYDKQMAQQAVREILGRDVADNRIAVDTGSGDIHSGGFEYRSHHSGHGPTAKHRPHLQHFPR